MSRLPAGHRLPATRHPSGNRQVTANQQNLLLWSQDVTKNPSYASFPVTATGGFTDPFGGTAAQQVITTLATGIHEFLAFPPLDLAFTDTKTYTSSVWLKSAVGATNALVILWFCYGFEGFTFNLTTGVVSANPSRLLVTVTPYSGGWWLVSTTYSGIVTGGPERIYILNSAGASSYAGTGFEGVQVYGWQRVKHNNMPPYKMTTTVIFSPVFPRSPA